MLRNHIFADLLKAVVVDVWSEFDWQIWAEQLARKAKNRTKMIRDFISWNKHRGWFWSEKGHKMNWVVNFIISGWPTQTTKQGLVLLIQNGLKFFHWIEQTFWIIFLYLHFTIRKCEVHKNEKNNESIIYY